ncbi:MAG TPA: hypothetical protein VF665_22245 [Longimicrobium sp.]|jgi:hypothetical protein|uniref:hypothetical protein n=1 Tax=Longimicrobium sp. TaxID=2029185 RepID=UPI002ED9EE2B
MPRPDFEDVWFRPTAPDSRHDAPRMQGLSYPEHTWMGNTVVAALYIAAAAVFAASVRTGILYLDDREPGVLGMSISAVALGLLAGGYIAALGYSVRRFACWAWFFLMIPLAVTCSVYPLRFIFGDHIALLEIPLVLMPAVLWTHYLWKRRLDFWFEGDAVRRAIDFEQNGHRWERRSWRDDARKLKKRMAERAIAESASTEAVPRSTGEACGARGGPGRLAARPHPPRAH